MNPRNHEPTQYATVFPLLGPSTLYSDYPIPCSYLNVVRGTTFAINTNNTYRQPLSYTNQQKSSTLIISAVNQCSAIINRLYLPINTAPAISNTVAKMQACLTVRTFDPTEVPNELATSLAPIPNAKTNAVTKPRTTSHSTSGEKGSSVNRLCGVDCTASMVQSVWHKHSRFCLAHGTHPFTKSSVWRPGHPWLAVHKCSSVPQPFCLYLISQLSFLPLSLRLLSTVNQVPNKYPTIRKYLSSCYKNKLQNNTSRTILIIILILLPLCSFFFCLLG